MNIPSFDRKDAMQRPRTLSLFLETNQSSLDPIFTLKEDDHTLHGVLYYSLKKIYLEIADPTEYQFAQLVFGSWKHWKKLCDSPPIKPHIEEWRDELEIKLTSQAVRSMIETAQEEGSKGVTAAKYVAERGWEKQAGRPSKQEVERTKKKYAGIRDEIDEDAKNIGLLN